MFQNSAQNQSMQSQEIGKEDPRKKIVLGRQKNGRFVEFCGGLWLLGKPASICRFDIPEWSFYSLTNLLGCIWKVVGTLATLAGWMEPVHHPGAHHWPFKCFFCFFFFELLKWKDLGQFDKPSILRVFLAYRRGWFQVVCSYLDV